MVCQKVAVSGGGLNGCCLVFVDVQHLLSVSRSLLSFSMSCWRAQMASIVSVAPSSMLKKIVNRQGEDNGICLVRGCSQLR